MLTPREVPTGRTGVQAPGGDPCTNTPEHQILRGPFRSSQDDLGRGRPAGPSAAWAGPSSGWGRGASGHSGRLPPARAP